jgi:hypothetical protein
LADGFPRHATEPNAVLGVYAGWASDTKPAIGPPPPVGAPYATLPEGSMATSKL